MAYFTDYAEILTKEHTQYRAYVAGIKKTPPGRTLAALLEQTGGVYEYDLRIPEDFRERIRKVAELTSDADLLKIADRGRAKVSFEHLRGIDPQTVIVFGHRLTYTPQERKQLRLSEPPTLDPKNTMYHKR